jgi:aromatic-L-amino-acid/L-tryptophan decarboxylase
MTREGFLDASARVAEWIADYRARLPELPVLARVEPGATAARIPEEPPEGPEALEAILDDLDEVIVPGLTHWNHPGFFGYFSSSSADPGVLAEFVAAALNVNAMLWRTGPAATELEERMTDWLRRFVGLPEGFHGVIQDTASSSSFAALLAARERALPGTRSEGLAAAGPAARPVVYQSDQAHSSIDKAAVAAGIGLANVRHIASDGAFRMRPDALEAAIRTDRGAGRTPVMVTATVGTTSSTSVDPVEAIAEICAEHGVWLHVDAAYAGPAASLPELRPLFRGWERADSVVLNPHKWMMTPVDCSVLLFRDPDAFRASLALTPEYLRSGVAAPNLMDIGLPLGRRFRSLKLWFLFRWYGSDGLRAILRRHVELAGGFRAWIEEDPRFALAAPAPFSTVCFRALPPEGGIPADEWNRRLLEAVNARGRVFLSHTVLGGRYALRLAIGSAWVRDEDVRAAREELAGEHERMRAALDGDGGGKPGPRPEGRGGMLKEGDAAPEFDLATDGGGRIRLSELRGERVVLYFYPKDDTSGCTKEACSFRDSMENYRTRGIRVLGVSPDGVASHDRFRDKYDLNFPLLSDPDHAVAGAYGAWGTKSMYGRKYEGVLRSTFVIGSDGRIEKVYPDVKPAEHAERILEDLGA